VDPPELGDGEALDLDEDAAVAAHHLAHREVAGAGLAPRAEREGPVRRVDRAVAPRDEEPDALDRGGDARRHPLALAPHAGLEHEVEEHGRDRVARAHGLGQGGLRAEPAVSTSPSVRASRTTANTPPRWSRDAGR
jgi:hypothetical protein